MEDEKIPASVGKQNTKIAKLEAHFESVFSQIKELKEEIKSLIFISGAIEKIDLKTQSIEEKVDELSKKIRFLENDSRQELAEYKKTVIKTVISTSLGIGLGAIFTLILK